MTTKFEQEITAYMSRDLESGSLKGSSRLSGEGRLDFQEKVF